ncbi:MAG: hypothetical protein A2033_15675 [Bacteroidetes bacterium GWA2_31_9]|nr:MAG: hypothetical protein A2033_15675 [Bacteroidetes bacterium GWA2_31_9]
MFSEYSVSISGLIGIIPVIFSIIFSIQLLLIKNINPKENRVLSIYIAFLGFTQLILILNDFKLAIVAQYLLPLFISVLLAIPPLMYRYILINLNQPIKRFFRHLILSLIVFITTSVSISVIIINPKSEFINVFFNILSYSILAGMIGVFTFQNIFYIFKSIRKYRNYCKEINETISYEDTLKLRWVLIYIIGYLIFIACVYLSEFFNAFWGDIFFSISLLAYIIFLWQTKIKQFDTLFILRQASIVEADKAPEKEIITTSKTEKNVEYLSELYSKINTLVESEKLYLNKELSIFDIAKKIGINYKYISQAINLCAEKNFILFINEYRIKEAISLLNNPENNQFTIEAISELAGFQSKSSFNTYFKKITGKTPSEFKQK